MTIQHNLLLSKKVPTYLLVGATIVAAIVILDMRGITVTVKGGEQPMIVISNAGEGAYECK